MAHIPFMIHCFVDGTEHTASLSKAVPLTQEERALLEQGKLGHVRDDIVAWYDLHALIRLADIWPSTRYMWVHFDAHNDWRLCEVTHLT